MTHPRDAFPRTVCDCPKCSAPCRHMPGMLAPGDMGRIADHLGQIPDDILPMFRASPGAKVARLNSDTGQPEVFRIHTIVPASTDTGECVFLQPDGRCSIHPVAPFGCSHFDWHMSPTEANPRSAACLREILQDIEYQRKWFALNSRGLVADGPEVRRARLRERTGNV